MAGQETDELAVVALALYCQHSLDQGTVSRLLQRCVLEEGVDGRQTRVATASAVPTVFFKVFEESPDDRSVQVFEREGRRLLVEPLASEAKQESEGIPVCCNRVRA